MPIEIQQNASLAAFNTLGLNVAAERLVIARSESDVCEALALVRDNAWPLTVLGGGSNVVLTGNVSGLTLINGIPGILFDGTSVDVGAGEGWHQLVLASLEQGLSGLENLSLIPGSAGAAPIQNIGAYGVELDAVFDRLWAINRTTLETVTFDRKDCEFGYRDSVFKQRGRDQFIITGIRLSLSDNFVPDLGYADLAEAIANDPGPVSAALISEVVCRIRQGKLPDPAQIGNVGSFFKNPIVDRSRLEVLLEKWPALPNWPNGTGAKVGAGWLIDQCGLRGRSVGGASVYDHHALVLINRGGATPEDVLELARIVRTEVRERFDLELEIEPNLIQTMTGIT